MNRFFHGIGLSLVIMAIAGTLHATVTGPCSKCHTMHNSQEGEPMAIRLDASRTAFEEDATPNPALLISDCVGCHTMIGNATIEIQDGVRVPIVFNTESPEDPLAGGNFHYVGLDDAKGHNVQGLTGLDITFQGKEIPGSTTGYYQLTCAGEHGCHGDRSMGDELNAIRSAHHANDLGGIDGSSVGLSYRFLDGILGKEDSDWEQDNTNTSHNEYQGALDFGITTTISYLCGQCHGNAGDGGFHNSGGVGSSSPWLRHPTDIALRNTGEYANYTTYSMVAPVARPNPDAVLVPTQVTPGTDIIMCLSCHRAHGSPYFKLMRWDYKNWPPGNSGCAVCHTSKD